MTPPHYTERLIDCGDYTCWFCWWSLAMIAVWVRTLIDVALYLKVRVHFERDPDEYSPFSQLGRFPTGFG